MSAHWRIATENASLGQPEVKLGILPGYGGMQRLPRLVGPEAAAELCANGEPVGGRVAVEIGLADEFRPSATALVRAVRLAEEFVAGRRPLPRREWDAIGASQREALAELLSRPDVRELLAAPTPDAKDAADPGAARRAAARDAIRAMAYGYEHGFAQGLRNDARAFGDSVASPGGQEWVRRFLAKDPLQSSYRAILPPAVA